MSQNTWDRIWEEDPNETIWERNERIIFGNIT